MRIGTANLRISATCFCAGRVFLFSFFLKLSVKEIHIPLCVFLFFQLDTTNNKGSKAKRKVLSTELIKKEFGCKGSGENQ